MKKIPRDSNFSSTNQQHQSRHEDVGAKPLIIDMGTQSVKVGFSELNSGERFP